MNRTGRMVFILAIIGILMVPAVSFALDPLGDLLLSLDKRAKSDLITFNKELSHTFGLPVPDVEKLFKVLPTPGDVYMALRISELTDKPTRRVVREYKRSKGRGWGEVAKRMGIKPGSKRFHALKEGRLPVHHRVAPYGTRGGGKGKHGKGGGGPFNKGGGRHDRGR